MPRRASQLALAALLIAAGVLRAEPPPTTATDAAPAAAEPASPAPADDAGKRLYARHCLSCHQADGGGVPNMQPAIAGGTWVKGDPGALALFVMTGGFDSAQRKDSEVDNVMPPFAQLGDHALAAILTYIRQKFGGGASAVDAAQVAEARGRIPK
jgi:mono/diheme cytochrome c family protein